MLVQDFPSPSSVTNSDESRIITSQITLRVPQSHHDEPIISKLVSAHGLTVNIKAALLGENTQEDGWFNLELQGTSCQIQSAMVYLEELDLELWDRTQGDRDEGW